MVSMTSEDKKDASRFLPNLWHSFVQIIIQSRLGEKAYTVSRSPAKGSSLFSLEICGNEEVTHAIKKYMGNQVLSSENPFSIEILLRTKEGEVMVLEVWTLSVEDNVDTSQKTCQIVTDRMSALLKSAICVSRITPAYGLSFRQSFETFIILYRLYTGKPDYNCLGENSVSVKVGQANIQSAYLSIRLAYRTVLAFPAQTRNLTHDQMMLKSDHFKIENSPKHHKRVSERVTDSSENAQTSDESQDALRLPFNSQMDLHSASPRSRTSSDSSSKGSQPVAPQRIYVPFANYRASSPEELSMPEEEPFSNLLVSASLPKAEGALHMQDFKDRKERRESESENEDKASNAETIREKSQMNTSDHSNKSFSSTNATKEENEYVVVNLKTPFVGSEKKDSELSSFYKEWQTAPPLRMFAEQEEEDGKESFFEKSLCLNEQIKCFEECVDEYEDLVKSLHIEDQNSQEMR